MTFEGGKYFEIPANTKFWCITIQETISLDRSLICELSAWSWTKDMLFGYGTIELMGGIMVNKNLELDISTDRVREVKIETYFNEMMGLFTWKKIYL